MISMKEKMLHVRATEAEHGRPSPEYSAQLILQDHSLWL